MGRRLLVLALAATVSLTAGPASAGEPPPGVLLSYEYQAVPSGGGYYVVVVCNATADPGVLEDVPVGAVVECSVNGTSSGRQGLPGREAVAVVAGHFSAPIEVCLSGEAVFLDLDGGAFVFVGAGPHCETLPLSG